MIILALAAVAVAVKLGLDRAVGDGGPAAGSGDAVAATDADSTTGADPSAAAEAERQGESAPARPRRGPTPAALGVEERSLTQAPDPVEAKPPAPQAATAAPPAQKTIGAGPERPPGAGGDPAIAGRPSAPVSTRRASRRMQIGLDLFAENRPVDARRELSRALESGELDDAQSAQLRALLTDLNDRLVFSPVAVDTDPFALTYSIEDDDFLSRIPRKLGLQVDWRFIQRINRIAAPEKIQLGQRIKLITGPFHAIVHKRDYRMDVYLGDGSDRVFVRSFPVGLGEYNSTPEGRFRVRPNSKLINPEWRNPRTRRLYEPDDPANPIGEHWIGLAGDEEHLRDVQGYGIHGTIEPESIGSQASMGCVRMLPEDVELVWGMLTDVSTVEIRP